MYRCSITEEYEPDTGGQGGRAGDMELTAGVQLGSDRVNRCPGGGADEEKVQVWRGVEVNTRHDHGRGNTATDRGMRGVESQKQQKVLKKKAQTYEN